jgi:hypothetical protein
LVERYAAPNFRAKEAADMIRAVADLLADVVEPGPNTSATALSMRKVAERAREHEDEVVRRVADELLAALERSLKFRSSGR